MDKVSKTPRTNFVAHESGDVEWNKPINRFGRMMAHACILERELAAQKKPCTDAKEQGHGCYRAVKAENELAAQKEHYRVLEEEMLVVNDERLCATLDAKENMDIANEFKRLMEQYRQHAEAAYIESARLVKMLALANEQIKENVKVLGIAAEMLSSQYYCDSSPAEVLKHLITKAKEMK